MPSLVTLYNEFENSGFVVLAVDVLEKIDIVEAFVRKQKLPFPVLMDTKGVVSNLYKIRAHPVHFMINRKGELVEEIKGARDWASDQSRTFVRDILKK